MLFTTLYSLKYEQLCVYSNSPRPFLLLLSLTELASLNILTWWNRKLLFNWPDRNWFLSAISSRGVKTDFAVTVMGECTHYVRRWHWCTLAYGYFHYICLSLWNMSKGYHSVITLITQIVEFTPLRQKYVLICKLWHNSCYL